MKKQGNWLSWLSLLLLCSHLGHAPPEVQLHVFSEVLAHLPTCSWMDAVRGEASHVLINMRTIKSGYAE